MDKSRRLALAIRSLGTAMTMLDEARVTLKEIGQETAARNIDSIQDDIGQEIDEMEEIQQLWKENRT